ncbi:MAG: tyrosine-protein phosphatase [Acidobacteria bacterium]|nr:tyrosine-protein phosphatase [Acidobacteriota bacterium]
MIIIIMIIMVLTAAVSAGMLNSDDIKSSGGGPSSVHVSVENFGKVTDFYYRGAQPGEADYEQLSALGIKTVIDLRDDPKGYARPSALKSGMKYISLPMSDNDYPKGDVATTFLSIVNNKENWPVFVHCAGGRHRTGAMTAVYRMTIEGWDFDRAYAEMKNYDFYTRWGHKAMKQFVIDYYRELNTSHKDRKISADK